LASGVGDPIVTLDETREADDMAGERRDDAHRGVEPTLPHDAETDREYTTPGRREALERENPSVPQEPTRAGDFQRDANGKDRIASPAPATGGGDADEDAAVRREGEGEGGDGTPPRRRE
jgi:hypothetical protein